MASLSVCPILILSSLNASVETLSQLRVSVIPIIFLIIIIVALYMLIFHFGLFVFLFVLSFACFSNSIKALLLFFTFLAFFHRKSKMFRKHLHFLSLSLSLPPFKYLLTLSLFSSIIHILSLSHPSCRKCESIRERVSNFGHTKFGFFIPRLG